MEKKEIFEKYRQIGLNVNDASAELRMILDYLNIDPMKEIMGNDYTREEISQINEIVNKRVKTQIPLQYITEFGYFMGEKFKVNKYTLIPRPETEILVKECSKLIKKSDRILDIGTGSGCIAISLAKITGAQIDAVDISEHALCIARENAKIHNVNCNFFISDLFSNIKSSYDLIVSNPPYIPIKDIKTLNKSITEYEPHASLFTNDEFGMEFYEKIISESVTFLNNCGYLCFEAGINQSSKIIKAFQINGYTNISTIFDFNNIERVTIAQHFKKNTLQDNL